MHLCKCNDVADLLKTRSSPYVLSCRIWSFCIKGSRDKYMRTPEIGTLELRFLGMGDVADLRYMLPRQIW